MKVSKEIAEKVKQYQKLKSQTDKLYEELKEYFEEEQGLEGFCEPFITDKAKGQKQIAEALQHDLVRQKFLMDTDV